MLTELRKDVRFEAAHRLPNVPAGHKCERLHGHSFRVTIVVRGAVDPRLGWVVDYAEIERAWKPLHELLDHRYLNDVPGLENPTSELVARFIAERLTLPAGTLHSVVVHETCTASATVYLGAP